MSAAARALQQSVPPETHSVEMAEMHVSARLTDNLAAYGLGACVAVCIYDASLKVAGIAHIVAPQQQRYADATVTQIAGASPGKFADTAIPILIQKIDRAGGQRTGLRAAIIGGAKIFGALTSESGAASGLEIGARNIAAVRDALQKHDIKICATDVGGSCGRTVVFRVCDGAVLVKQIGGEASVLALLSKVNEEVVV